MIKIPASTRGHIAADLMPDLTPLLDVMFMLIVFFILTANAVPYTLDVNVPEDKNEVAQPVSTPDMLSVTLLPNGQGWKINETAYTAEPDFTDALLNKLEHNKKVIIIGDKNVSMEKLLNIMTLLRKNNIETADIIMEKR